MLKRYAKCTLIVCLSCFLASLTQLSANAKCDPALFSSAMPDIKVEPLKAAGNEFTIRWQKKDKKAPENSIEYLIFSVNPNVRLKGSGFYSLMPGALLPFAMKVNQDWLRAIFHFRSETSFSRGEVTVSSASSGKQTIKATLISIDVKNMCIEKKDKEFSVVLDHESKPSLVLFNPYENEGLKKTISSPDKATHLKVYDRYFELVDQESQNLIARINGWQPRFSPTSRFLTFFESELRAGTVLYVYDVLFRKVVAKISMFESLTDVIGWLDHDSMLVVSGTSWGSFAYMLPIVDRTGKLDNNYITETTDCHACNFVGESTLHISKEFGYLIAKGPLDTYGLSILTYRSLPKAVTKQRLLDSWLWINQGLKITSMYPSGKLSEYVLKPKVIEHSSQVQEVQKYSRTMRGYRRTQQGRVPLQATAFVKRLWDYGLELSSAQKLQAESDQSLSVASRKDASLKVALKKVSEAESSTSEVSLIASSWVKQDQSLRVMYALHHCMCTADYASGSLIISHASPGTQHQSRSSVITYQGKPVNLGSSGEEGKEAELDVWIDQSKRVIISQKYFGEIYVLEHGSSKAKFAIKKAKNLFNASRISLSADHKLLVQENSDGQFYIYQLASGSLIVSGYYVDDEIVMYSPEGIFDGTPEGTSYVSWYLKERSEYIKLSQATSLFQRPDYIQSLLKGEPLKIKLPQLSSPPHLDFELLDQKEGQASLRLKAKSETGLRKIEVYRDGVLQKEISLRGQDADKRIKVDLAQGKQWLTLLAYDHRGLTSLPKTLLIEGKGTKIKKRLFALLVGVDDYPLNEGLDLSYSKADVRSLRESFERDKHRYDRLQIKTLVDAKVKPESVLRSLDDLSRQVTKDDLTIIFFAGHGVQSPKTKEFYYMTSDSRFDDIDRSGLAWEKISKHLDRFKGPVLVLLDTCHSGSISKLDQSGGDDQISTLLKPQHRAGRAVIASSKGRQSSYESISFGGHGLFTSVLLELMTAANRDKADLNRSGMIELSELYRFVRSRVVSLSKGKQVPWMPLDELIGQLPLF